LEIDCVGELRIEAGVSVEAHERLL
jgi:hypothetical protein